MLFLFRLRFGCMRCCRGCRPRSTGRGSRCNGRVRRDPTDHTGIEAESARLSAPGKPESARLSAPGKPDERAPRRRCRGTGCWTKTAEAILRAN